jgi:hypothetical protein
MKALIVLQRRTPRPRLRDGDRRFWILACRWVPRWRESLLVVQPATVLGWHRRGWTAYWRWRSRCRRGGGRPRIAGELRALIRRMAAENFLWGQRRIQGELARLGFGVSARTVARYMRRPYHGVPSPSWRDFLRRHAQDIWACDFFSVRTILFQTLHVFFVMHHETQEILQARVTRHPTAEWAAQQIVAACGWERDPPRYLIRDRDGRFGIEFDRRVQRLGVTRIRTPNLRLGLGHGLREGRRPRPYPARLPADRRPEPRARWCVTLSRDEDHRPQDRERLSAVRHRQRRRPPQGLPPPYGHTYGHTSRFATSRFEGLTGLP